MYNYQHNFLHSTYSGSYDYGLKKYFAAIFQYMSASLFLTGIVSFIIGSSPFISTFLYTTPASWVVIFLPILYLVFFTKRFMFISVNKALIHLFIFSVVNGVSLGTVFMLFTKASILRVFLITSVLFLMISFIGFFTKKDLTIYGRFAYMIIIGLIVISLVSLFFPSSRMNFFLSILAVIVFSVVTAYDMQKLKNMYHSMNGNSLIAVKIALFGALSLYLDFLNIFVNILNIIGVRKNVDDFHG